MALIFCSHCGAKVSDRARACPKCGNELASAPAAEPSAKQPAAPESDFGSGPEASGLRTPGGKKPHCSPEPRAAAAKTRSPGFEARRRDLRRRMPGFRTRSCPAAHCAAARSAHRTGQRRCEMAPVPAGRNAGRAGADLHLHPFRFAAGLYALFPDPYIRDGEYDRSGSGIPLAGTGRRSQCIRDRGHGLYLCRQHVVALVDAERRGLQQTRTAEGRRAAHGAEHRRRLDAREETDRRDDGVCGNRCSERWQVISLLVLWRA